MSLRTQFKSLLEPELLEGFVNQTLSLKIFRYPVGQSVAEIEDVSLGPLPPWFTLYEVKLALWNSRRLDDGSRDPAFAPPLVFLGKPTLSEDDDRYYPVEMLWMSNLSGSGSERHILELENPLSLMTQPPDSRFVDSAGRQRAIGKDNRIRMTLNDIFQLDEGKTLPELHVFLYTDLVDRIAGPRPLGERDVYGRIVPYFPYLNQDALPTPTSLGTVVTPVLVGQAEQTEASLKQILYLEDLLQNLGGDFQLPKLDGLKFLRWVWNQKPVDWEGAAILFFGLPVTHERPYMRFFPVSGQPLTKIKVRGILPIPDLPDPNLLLGWKQDKNPDMGKECAFMKMRLQTLEVPTEIPLYATMRVFNDGTSDLIILPQKQKRLLDPYSDLQDSPEALERCLSDTPYIGQKPNLGQADVVVKIRLQREDVVITKQSLQKRLKAFSSIFQQIPPLPDEQPLAMLRYKGVSNFSSEDRIFAFLTQIAAHEMVEGEVQEDTWAPRVASEFKISLDEARKKVIEWTVQRNEYVLAVPETKDYILNKNPGVDIAIFAQHPTYNFHIYRVQSFQIYTTIINLLGLLISAPADRFTETHAAVKAATIAKPELGAPAPAPAAAEENDEGVFLNEDAPAANDAEGYFPNQDDVPDFMMGVQQNDAAPPSPVAAPPPPPPPAAAPAPAPAAAAAPAPAAAAKEDEEDKMVAKAFEKPTNMKAIKVKKYYIDKLKTADPELFDYVHPTDRGYVSHCAANESRQPIVLDNDEYREMRGIYDEDQDLEIIVYPEDSKASKFKKRQPGVAENVSGMMDGKSYPSDEDKEVITMVRYGSKPKRVHYYFCPRLFCIRDRLMVRQKDFKATVDRKGSPKPANSCPFCKGTLISSSLSKETDRDPNSTVLQRKTRPGSETERQIYVGFLGTKKNPAGMSLPCCFADGTDKFNPNDPEFVRLGLRPGAQQKEVAAQAAADEFVGTADENVPEPAAFVEVKQAKYEPNYYRVIQGVSVKSIVDSNKIPLDIVVPKASAIEDPKNGPQIGLLSETLDKYFLQDSKSTAFAERVEIVRKLKAGAKGFLRLAVDNNKDQMFLSAVAPFINNQPNADKLIENVLENLISLKMFIQLNGGNLVHEFFNKCEPKNQNDMRVWAAKYLGIDELQSTNIPPIQRIMNAYECFNDYMEDPKQKKEYRILYNVFSEPAIMRRGQGGRGIMFIILEVSVEYTLVKRGEKTEQNTEVRFERVRCPAYPLTKSQYNADVGFIVHYSTVTRDRYNPERKTYKTLAWEPLFYVDGTKGVKEGRHKPTLLFQRSEEASWPPIVQRRVSEFFYNCVSVNRGPFTSSFGINPNALIAAEDLINAVILQPTGTIRDSYNHLVGIAYKGENKSQIIAVPIADDGSLHPDRRLFLDWDDFTPSPADEIIEFYETNINNFFSEYRGYNPRALQKSRNTGKIIGIVLLNGFSIPASEPNSPAEVAKYQVVDVDDLEWDINRTIAYDSTFRQKAFKIADEEDPDADRYTQLKISSIQDEIEDVYQHLRLTFSNWLATAGAGRDIRDSLEQVLKRYDLPLFEKRKRLDILLEDKVIHWLEPRDKEEDPDLGFLRVDCHVQSEDQCSGRCKWVSEKNVCKIHTPAKTSPNGIVLNVPRMLYLRLVDELIRFASKRQEIFLKQVPRLTIRQEAQRKGDQYIVPEGTPDWNSWWEFLRKEWVKTDKDATKFFDEQYEPAPSRISGDTDYLDPEDDKRTLPESLKEAFGSDDPKIENLVWNPSREDVPFIFLKPILRKHKILSRKELILTGEELKDIANLSNAMIRFMPNGVKEGTIVGRPDNRLTNEMILIAVINGIVGWVSTKDSYSIKVPFHSLPDSVTLYGKKELL